MICPKHSADDGRGLLDVGSPGRLGLLTVAEMATVLQVCRIGAESPHSCPRLATCEPPIETRSQ